MKNNWVTTPINKFCKIVSGSTPKTSEPTYWGGDIAWVTPMDLSKLNNKYITNGARNITRSGLKSCSAELIPANSLVMSSRAPIGYFAINKSPVATNQGCKSFVCDNSIDIEFLYYALNQHIDSIKRLGSGSTFAEVGKKQIESLIIKIPSKAIQHKIEDILSAIDETIQKTDQIIQKFEELKSGLMNELLTKGIGHKKFKKTKIGIIPEHWTLQSLQELCSKIVDGVHKKPDYVSSGIPFITIKNLTAGQGISFNDVNYISESDHKEFIKRAYPCKGDVLVTKDGTLGIARVIETELPFSIFVSVALLKPIREKLDNYFLRYAIESPILMQQFLSSGSGSALRHIHLVDFRRTLLPLPPIEEQRKIAEILSEVDIRLDKESKQKESLIKLKNGLMQDIFSQKVQIN